MARLRASAVEPARSAASRAREAEAGRLRRIAAWLIPEADPAGAVYGLITVGALLAAEGALHDTYAEVIGAVAITMSLYGFAHAYAELLGRRLAARERPGRIAYGVAVARGLAVLQGASLPLIVLLVSWATGVVLGTAVTVAIWTAVVSLIALELAAGYLAHAGRRELALDAGVGAAMGLGILALKALVA
jgi:hypothetical protein